MNHIKIGKRLVGEGQPCFVIAEAGVNHNGDLKRAKKMIQVAYKIGADAVKFQTFKTDECITKNAPKANYQKDEKNSSETQYNMLKKLEFSEEQWYELSDFAKDINIILFSKPSYERAVDILEKMKTPVFKIGSGDVTYLSLIRRVARTGLPIILSTGMSTIDEIKDAIEAIHSEKNKDIFLLHCTSNYPCKYEDVNLRAMLTLKKKFNLPVGYSDHTIGITVPLLAVSMGACIIEKHFTLDKKLLGPDHKASLEPKEFEEMVNQIRTVEEILGNTEKKPTKSEEEIRKVARKSIVANTDIKKGDVITKDLLSYKRPGTGLPQKYLGKIIGKKAKVNISKDEIIRLNMI